MGIMADNERIKLRATYFNNLGVGLVLGGALLPYLSVVRYWAEISDKLNALQAGQALTRADVLLSIGYVTGIAIALYFGYYFRLRADAELKQIRD